MNQRALALDALRGYAIITMVLSATIISSILPGWMSHAQTPPPEHIFNPEIPGITWVDLVFPFFLFAMGAAFPFSIGRHAEKGRSKLMLCYDEKRNTINLLCYFYPTFLSLRNKFSTRLTFLVISNNLLYGFISYVYAYSISTT